MRCRARDARSSVWRAIASERASLLIPLMTIACASISSLLAQMSGARLRALFSQEAHRAAEWVYAIAADGLPKAQLCYARLLLEGTGVPKDAVKAFEWIQRAAVSGDIEAMNMLGRCFDNGWGTSEDPAAAAAHYARAAEAGDAWAQYNLGHLYLDGRGVARDLERAFAYYRSAAEQQHERAMNLVGRCYEQGWGTVRDSVAAADWYRRSAERGYFRGQYNWATLLLKANRVAEAAVWFECAANGGTVGVRRAVLDAVNRALREMASAPAQARVSGPTANDSLRELGSRLRAQLAG
jgi:uncharacterized protein